MRKQYHLLPSKQGFDAWDVDRLIRLSKDLPVKQVPLSAIAEVDDVYWFQERAVPPTVREVVDHVRLMQEVDLSHPIILGADGRVMDGMHRVARALLEGQPTVAAVRFETDPEPDYRDCDPRDLPYTDDPEPASS